MLDIATYAKAGPSPGVAYAIDLELSNVASVNLRLTQITAMSHMWICSSPSSNPR